MDANNGRIYRGETEQEAIASCEAAEQSFAPYAPPETCEHGNLPSKCPVEICSYSKHGGRR